VFDGIVVVRDLRAAGVAFGLPSIATPVLRWSLLLAALDDTTAEDHLTAIELIYEGYLFHYRESRLCAIAPGEHETALLAGDFLYARGLRLIAERGDVGAVDLLARLMAVCSSLRSAETPFSADDALWAYSVGGLVSLHLGADAVTLVKLFDMLDESLADDRAPDVRSLARDFVPVLALPDPSPLVAELEGSESPSAGQGLSLAAAVAG
jgi:hypothetical protein